MTVCIGTIAAKSQAIVMVADKSVTYRGGGAAMQYDTGIRKIIPVGLSGWHALIAGDPTFGVDVIDQAKALISANPSCAGSGTRMMTCVQDAYRRCREKAVIDNILTPNLLSKELLVARPASLLPLQPEHNSSITNQVADYRAGTSVLICGFDQQKKPQAHIFSVRDPGIYENYDLTGFHAIGIGNQTAIARLLLTDTDRKDALLTALYGAFDAKAAAEIMQGVGYEWDAEILVSGKGKSVKVPRSVTGLIDNVFGSFPKSPFDQSFDMPPKNWAERLTKFSLKVMPSGDIPDAMWTKRHKARKVKR